MSSRIAGPQKLLYRADITAGSLNIPESRIIANLLLQNVTKREWKQAVYEENVLQARSPQTAKRYANLIRSRLELFDADFWKLVSQGSTVVATHACLAAAVKQSRLLGDFLDLVVQEQYRIFSQKLTRKMWEDYIEGCRGRDPEMPQWSESTIKRLRSTVFQILAQSGYIDNTRNLTLQPVHIASEVLVYLNDHNEQYVLRCIQNSP